MSKKLSVSIGIFAYNEERNIERVYKSVLKQKLDKVTIKEIVVVSSGSYDRTNQLVRGFQKKDKRVRFIEQLKREGKSSAINLFINQSKTNLLVVISSDIRLHPRAIEEISLPFLHEDVGMVGAHPVPVNVDNSSIGKQIDLLWKFHHLVSLQSPKCGEMIAFRKVIRQIPSESAVDEATLEVLLQIIGYKIAYAPQAIVYNRGPVNLCGFLTQRRRVYVGHKWLQHNYHYQVSTMKTISTAKVIRQYLLKNPRELVPTLKLISFEFLGRLLGWLDFYILKRNPYVWDMVER